MSAKKTYRAIKNSKVGKSVDLQADRNIQRTDYEGLMCLLKEWMADESGYDEAVWPILQKELGMFQIF